MKLFSGIITILFALLISATAAWFSVAGLIALFAATAIPVLVMGTVLETSKLVAAGWLHANWKNSNVNFLHKSYLTLAVLALMLITAIGIYGFLSKGHLEQSAPVAGIELQVNAKQQQIEMLTDANARLTTELKQLDASVDLFLQNGKATAGLRARNNQTSERKSIQKQMNDNNDQISKLSADILPLKQQTAEVEAKLGPVKYVAQLFGWQDTDKAVRLVILVIMFAFDPLAVILLISATISFAEYAEEQRTKKATPPAANYDGDYEELTSDQISQIRSVAATELEDIDMSNIEPFDDNSAGLYRVTQDQLVDPIEPIINSNNVTVTEHGSVVADEIAKINELTPNEHSDLDSEVEEVQAAPEVTVESIHASEETITSIRSDLEDIHGRIEPIFGIPTTVDNAEEPTLQADVSTQDDEDKLAAMRAADPMPPDFVVIDEVTPETAPETHQEPADAVAIPVVAKAPNDKERLIEILEKRPEILQDLIDVISSHRQQEEIIIAKATVAPSIPTPAPWIR